MTRISIETFQKMAADLREACHLTVLPLGAFTTDRSDAYPIGTGTLFAVGERKFIVSAGHVAEAVEEGSGSACVFVPSEVGEHGTRMLLVPIGGRALRVPDPVDVVVLELSEETGNALSGCRFLRLSEVALSPEPLGCGWVCGFPHEQIRNLGEGSRGFDPLSMATVIRPHDGDGLDNFDPTDHFLLDANRSAFEWSDGSGQASLPSRFHGISGSAVWQSWWPSLGHPDEKRSRIVRVVGVQTGYYRGQSVIKATRWGCVAEVLRQSFPDLRPILKMHFGPGFGN